MHVQAISNVSPNFTAKNTTIIAGEFLNNGPMTEYIVSELKSNTLYKKFCNSNDTRTVINTMKPSSTCIAMFDVFYKPARKGIMKLFSFLYPYEHFSFGGYGDDYKQAFKHLMTQMFDPTVGLLNDRLSAIMNPKK